MIALVLGTLNYEQFLLLMVTVSLLGNFLRPHTLRCLGRAEEPPIQTCQPTPSFRVHVATFI
jgi:hypothetical protein